MRLYQINMFVGAIVTMIVFMPERVLKKEFQNIDIKFLKLHFLKWIKAILFIYKILFIPPILATHRHSLLSTFFNTLLSLSMSDPPSILAV